MSALDAKREEIAAVIANELGFGDLDTLEEGDRAAVDEQTAETIEAWDDERADGADAHVKLAPLLAEYRALQQLRTDEANARLADEGEVFSPEDDA